MRRILLRAGKSPFDVIGCEPSLTNFPGGSFGTNVGNLVFSDAVHRILSTPDTEVVENSFLSERAGVTDDYIDRINSEFDHFAIPLANAFRIPFLSPLQRLTETIKRLRIPVSVIGVGVHGGAGSLSRSIHDVPAELREAVVAFMKAALNHSPKVGVRGENTRSFLRTLGFGDDAVEVIGCPSLFRNGLDQAITKGVERLSPQSRIAMNISPYVPYMGPSSLYHSARYPHLRYIPQDYQSAETMMWGTNPPTFAEDMPTHNRHPLYAEDKMRFFVDSKTWIDYLKTFDFSFGTRIHGNIAALVAKTPAFVLVHDTRTQELVDYHQIPFKLVSDLPDEVDAADLFEAADYTGFNTGHRQRFETFHRFLHDSGLSTVFDPGLANPRYDEELSALRLPPPIRPVQQNKLADTIAARSATGISRSPDRYRFTARVPHERPSLLSRLKRKVSR